MQPSDSVNAIRTRYNTENSCGSRRESPSHFNRVSQGLSQSSTYNLLKQESTRWRSQPCYCCGSTGQCAKDIRCPANSKTCRNCGKVGHFSIACRSRPKPANYTSPPQNQALQVSEHNDVASYSDDDQCIFRVQQFPNLPTNNINVDGLSMGCY